MERYFEFQADEFSCEKGYAKHLLNGLRKVFRESALTIPDPLYAWCKHNHQRRYVWASSAKKIFRPFQPVQRRSGISDGNH